MNKEEVSERRNRTKSMVDKWLEERQQMLVLYCQVAGLEPYTPDRSNTQLLRDFCQVLVDYIAFGHFEVYDRISRGDERRFQVQQIAEDVYPRVLEVTDFAVAFNDKYDSTEHEVGLDDLDKDLSKLGAELATRIEMEDRVIGALLH